MMSRRTLNPGPLNPGGGNLIYPSKKKQAIPLTLNNVLLGCLAIGVVLVVIHYLLDPFHLPDTSHTLSESPTRLPDDFMELVSPARKPLWPPKPIKVSSLDPVCVSLLLSFPARQDPATDQGSVVFPLIDVSMCTGKTR